jgi:hypothetical protein
MGYLITNPTLPKKEEVLVSMHQIPQLRGFFALQKSVSNSVSNLIPQEGQFGIPFFIKGGRLHPFYYLMLSKTQ